jgi:ABC-type bacteriocin/lantibiotic exporter with double-glycine peptidase domain
MPNFYIYTLLITLKYLRKYPIYWVGVGVRTVYYLFEIAVPILFGIILNKISSGEANWNSILWPIIGYVCIKTFNPIIEVTTGYWNWNRGGRASQDYRSDMIGLLTRAKPNYFQNKSKGAVLSAINTATGGICRFAASLNQSYTGLFVEIIGIGIASYIISPWVLLVIGFNLVFFLINLIFTTREEKQLMLIENQKSENISGRITEFLNNFTTVIYLNLFEREKAEIRRLEDEYYTALTRREKVSIFKKWLNNHVLHGVTQAVILVILINEVVSGKMQIGTLSIIVMFAQRVLDRMNYTVQLVTEYLTTTTNVERAYTLVNKELAKNEVEDSSIAITAAEFKDISIIGVGLERENRETLSKISLEIPSGKRIAIVGSTGSGKSTLMDILLRVETDYTGKILLNGADYHNLSVAEIGKYISVVPQSVQLFKDTIKNNIVLSSEINDIELQKIIQVCELESLVKSLTEGINTEINESNTNISGGERQRIGLARSLAQNRQVLVLDEATASLDPTTERKVITNIITNFQHLTIVYVTHKYSLLNQFDDIVVINDGRIIEQGRFHSLLEDGGMFSDLYKSSLVS